MIGPLEILFVLVVGVLVFGIPIAILVLLLQKRNNADEDAVLIDQLRHENQRLRNELLAKAQKNS